MGQYPDERVVRDRVGWGGAGLSPAPPGQRGGQTATGDCLWPDQSASPESHGSSPAGLATSPLAHRKSPALSARCHLRRRRLSGASGRGTTGVGGTQWWGPRLDGLARRLQCGLSDAPFLRSSRGSFAVTVWQTSPALRVNQKALPENCLLLAEKRPFS